MRVAIAVILNSIIYFIFILSQSVFASSEILQKAWSDSSGKHIIIIDKSFIAKKVE